jgi:hypothetical protein
VRPPATGARNESAINLCTRIFADRYPAVGRAVFADLSRYLMLHMLSFTEAMAMTKRAARGEALQGAQHVRKDENGTRMKMERKYPEPNRIVFCILSD